MKRTNYFIEGLQGAGKSAFVQRLPEYLSDMGEFDIVDVKEAQKENNKGKKEAISKVQVKMHHPVRDDLLRYLQSRIVIEENAV